MSEECAIRSVAERSGRGRHAGSLADVVSQCGRARAARLDLRTGPPALRPGVAGGLAAARRRSTSAWSISPRKSSPIDQVRAGGSHRLSPADAHRDTAGRARHRADAERSTARHGSARTASTRRSTPTGCARSVSTMCSAASSKRTLAAIATAASACDGRARTGAGTARPETRRDTARRSRACSSWSPIARAFRRSRATRRCRSGDERRDRPGYTEASRGCRHLCRHCPVVPVYQGQFRVVQPDVVLADVARAGGGRRAAHHLRRSRLLQRSDPRRARSSKRCTRRIRTSPTTSRSRSSTCCSTATCSPRSATTGCLFVTSAVESIDDRMLAILDKGHTRQDVLEAVALCRDAGLTLVPTFVAFHPWRRSRATAICCRSSKLEDLVEHVAPIQLAIRLLIPQGSRLLETEEIAPPAALVRSGDARLPLDASRSARRRAARGGRRHWSASSLASDRREVFERDRDAGARARGSARGRARHRSRGRAETAVPYPERALVLLR